MQAAGYARQPCNAIPDAICGHAQNHARSDSRQHIVEIESAAQRGGYGQGALLTVDDRPYAFRRQRNNFCAHITAMLQSERQLGPVGLFKYSLSPGIITVHNHFTGTPLPLGGQDFPEKPQLGLKVIFHGLVIIKVVLRKIRKNAQRELTIVHPPQIHGMR